MGVAPSRRAGRGSPPEMASGLALYGYRHEIAPTSRTFTADDIGKDVFNTGATGVVTYTLPPVPSGGGRMRFINTGQVAGIIVAALVADTMVTFNDTAADSLEMSSTNASIGGVIECVSDGSNWICWVASDGNTKTVNT